MRTMRDTGFATAEWHSYSFGIAGLYVARKGA
jgi:ubiquinone/menaquinone biosynthesis C-methylase UbiE